MSNDYLTYMAILPVILLLLFIYKRDTHKEPKKLLRKTFIFGCLTVIPVIIVELIFEVVFKIYGDDTQIMKFASIFIGVALVEELFKWLVVRFIPYKDTEFDEKYDGIVYAVFSSLGFAVIENLLYCLNSNISVAILRALTAVPGHACDAVVMGYFLGLAKYYAINENKKLENKNLFFAILFPVITHTIYDYLLTAGIPLLSIIWLIFVIVFTIICFILVIKSSKSNIYLQKKNSSVYCKNCGNYVEGKRYCSKCGERTSNE